MADPFHVHLEEAELVEARRVGRLRNAEAKRRGLADKHGYRGQGAAIHALGAAGEIAVARLLGLKKWKPTVNTFKSVPDVGRVEVRTRSKHEYELLVRDDDPEDATYVLVTGSPPRMQVRGWMLGTHAKNPAWRHAHGGREEAFFVPQTALRDMAALGVKRPEPRVVEQHVCGYDDHRGTDWRLPNPNPWNEGQRWVCGLCHPCPFPEEFQIGGGVIALRTYRIERRDPSVPLITVARTRPEETTRV